MNNNNIMKKYLVSFALTAAFLVTNCTDSKPDKSKQIISSNESAYQQSVIAIENVNMSIKHYFISHSSDDYMKVYNQSKKLSFEYNNSDIAPEDRHKYIKQKNKIDSIKRETAHFLNSEIHNVKLIVEQKKDYLINEAVAYPLYLQRGSKIYIDQSMQGNRTTNFYNVDSKKLIKSYKAKNVIHDSIVIENSAIYLWEIKPTSSQYLDLTLKHSVNDIEDLTDKHTISVKKVDASANDFRANKYNTIDLLNVLEEPRKITLRSYLKSAFSGNHRSIVAIQIPKNANDIAFNLRISTDKQDRSEDGKFFNNTRDSYRKIRFLGLPVYESTGSKSSIIRELLNLNKPDREEDAYCNIYVFTNPTMARRFQNKEVITNLKYNLDYSMIGTQSCNGRIPCKGLKTIYLGFENERYIATVYLWLEVIATVPTIRYSMETYSL